MDNNSLLLTVFNDGDLAHLAGNKDKLKELRDAIDKVIETNKEMYVYGKNLRNNKNISIRISIKK